MSHSCSSVVSCPRFLPFTSCFGLHLSFWWESGARLCLWGLVTPVCHGVLEQLRRNPFLGMPRAEFQLWHWALRVSLEMHLLALGNRLFGQHGEGEEKPLKNGCSFFHGDKKKPNKTHPCQITPQGCPYPASGLCSVQLITACLAAETNS